MMRVILEGAGYTVSEARHGLSGLEFVKVANSSAWRGDSCAKMGKRSEPAPVGYS